jgi:hypothetical protein
MKDVSPLGGLNLLGTDKSKGRQDGRMGQDHPSLKEGRKITLI